MTINITQTSVTFNDNSVKTTARPLMRGIFGFGFTGASRQSVTNLVSSSGIITSNVVGSGTARDGLAAASFAGDKAIFGYGTTGTNTNITNIINFFGIVSVSIQFSLI